MTLKQFNQKINDITDIIMNKIADALAFKITFLLFCIIAIVPLFFQIPQDILSWQSYLSQTVIQLISLSILAVVSKKEGAKTERIINETHNMAMQELQSQNEEFENIKEMMSLLTDEVSLQKDETQELKDYTIELHTIISELALILHKLHIKEGENK